MSKKIDCTKLTLAEVAALDFRGDLRVRSRIRAGVTAMVEGGTLGVAPPTQPPKLGPAQS
jgi:hypothetical protein